jgi:hypothetical protein
MFFPSTACWLPGSIGRFAADPRWDEFRDHDGGLEFDWTVHSVGRRIRNGSRRDAAEPRRSLYRRLYEPLTVYVLPA